MNGIEILQGDCRETLKTLPDCSVHCVVTSPPYFGLRDYGCDGQIGLESTPDEFVAQMVQVFREVRRVLGIKLKSKCLQAGTPAQVPTAQFTRMAGETPQRSEIVIRSVIARPQKQSAGHQHANAFIMKTRFILIQFHAPCLIHSMDREQLAKWPENAVARISAVN